MMNISIADHDSFRAVFNTTVIYFIGALKIYFSAFFHLSSEHSTPDEEEKELFETFRIFDKVGTRGLCRKLKRWEACGFI